MTSRAALQKHAHKADLIECFVAAPANHFSLSGKTCAMPRSELCCGHFEMSPLQSNSSGLRNSRLKRAKCVKIRGNNLQGRVHTNKAVGERSPPIVPVYKYGILRPANTEESSNTTVCYSRAFIFHQKAYADKTSSSPYGVSEYS